MCKAWRDPLQTWSEKPVACCLPGQVGWPCPGPRPQAGWSQRPGPFLGWMCLNSHIKTCFKMISGIDLNGRSSHFPGRSLDGRSPFPALSSRPLPGPLPLGSCCFLSLPALSLWVVFLKCCVMSLRDSRECEPHCSLVELGCGDGPVGSACEVPDSCLQMSRAGLTLEPFGASVLCTLRPLPTPRRQTGPNSHLSGWSLTEPGSQARERAEPALQRQEGHGSLPACLLRLVTLKTHGSALFYLRVFRSTRGGCYLVTPGHRRSQLDLDVLLPSRQPWGLVLSVSPASCCCLLSLQSGCAN